MAWATASSGPRSVTEPIQPRTQACVRLVLTDGQVILRQGCKQARGKTDPLILPSFRPGTARRGRPSIRAVVHPDRHSRPKIRWTFADPEPRPYVRTQGESAEPVAVPLTMSYGVRLFNVESEGRHV